VPDIAVAIARIIDGIGKERAGHELHLPHRASPRSDHAVIRYVPSIDDLHCLDQLALKEIMAAAFIR
jgi:hypothetical protein